ncbi:MAG: MG2 domain-containing protein [Planctomycetota bacterium]
MSASNESNPWTPAEREQLEQELLELHFGCHESPEQLEARLAAEPQLRKLQQEMLAKADLLAKAVQPEQPKLDLPEQPKPSKVHKLASPLWRIGVAAAAAVLVAIGLYGYERSAHSRYQDLLRKQLQLTVSAPKAVPTGAPWSFTVQADRSYSKTACEVAWRAFDDQDQLLADGSTTLVDGSATVALAASLDAPRRIELIAQRGATRVERTLELSSAAAGPMVHIATDRQTYRPGESIFVRVVLLDRVTRLPLAKRTMVSASLHDPRDAQVVRDSQLHEESGVASFRLDVPEQSAGGIHRLKIASRNSTFPTETVDLVVRSFRNPKLQKRLVLDRKSYAPGQRGSAEVAVLRLGDNLPAAGARARGKLIVDGDEVWQESLPLDADGRARFRFEIPSDVEKGAARFVAIISDGSVVETEVQPFVVPTGRIDVALYAEGGELIAGVENRVYVECTDALGRAIDTAGELVDDRNRRIASFRTEHQGRGKISLIPEDGRSYRVRVAGRSETFDLPSVQKRGIALRLRGEDIAAGEPLRMHVDGRGDGPWVLGAFCRGVLCGQTTLRPNARGEVETLAEVELSAEASGVLRVTVFDRMLRPVAERLVRRRSAHRLDVALLPKYDNLLPGQRQQVLVTTRNERGRATPAVVGLSCTDQAITSLAIEPRVALPEHAELFCDVAKLEDLGDFFLSKDASPRNVDLLLGTRGWRRFVWRNDEQAKAAIAAAEDSDSSPGAWATTLLAREGFSQTPQAISNHAENRQASAPLSRSHWRARRTMQMGFVIVIGALLFLLLAEGIAWLLRKLSSDTSYVTQTIGGLAGAAAALALVWVFILQDLGASEDAVKGEMMAPGFAGEAALDRFVETPVPVTGSDDFYLGGTRRGAAPMREVAEAPAAGAIPPALEARPGPDLRVRGPGDRVPGDRVPGDRVPAPLAKLGPDLRLRVPRHQREYAHRYTPNGTFRTDFTPTIYWNTLLVTDKDGRAEAAFDTSDAVTTWNVTADAHVHGAEVGRLGSATARFATQLALEVDAKLPTEISAGDQLLLPVSCSCRIEGTTHAGLRVQLGPGLQLAADAPQTIPLTQAPGESGASNASRGRTLLPLSVADGFVGTTRITLQVGANSDGRSATDRIRRTITVAPRGFPHRRSSGGSMLPNTPGSWRVQIPTDPVANTLGVTLKVYPSPLAALSQGLEGMLREPHGCFEQASSTNYPNTLVLNLIEASGDNVPTVAARARGLLPKGYAKITGYECGERGYEWFGHDPGHESLTAYGLLQFHDMAKVYDVDAIMLDRTRGWLMAKRDGNGGFERNGKSLDRFGRAPELVTNAYVTYALLQAGTPAAELQPEIDALVARLATDDTYELAIVACALQLAERKEAANARRRLASMQDDDGSLPGAATTITMSGERDRLVETTGFGVLAWLPDPSFAANVRGAVGYLQGARNGGGTFGATQATIAALRALTAYAIANRAMRTDGVVRVFAGDQLIDEQPFRAGDAEAMTFELAEHLPAGEHSLRLEVQSESGRGDMSPLPWSGDVHYFAEVPATDPATGTAIATSLRQATVAEGETVALDIRMENRTAAVQPTPMATLGIPAGLEVPTKVLIDLQKAGRFAFWELTGRELVLYWRALDPEQSVDFTIDLIARVPGKTVGPASRTWLYYTPDQKRWAAPLEIEVTPGR